MRLRYLLLLALVLAARWLESHGDDAEQSISTYCSGDPDEIRKVHIEAIKRYILLKLGLSEPPKNPEVFAEDEEAEREYDALLEVEKESDSTAKPCVTQYDQETSELLVFFPNEIKKVFPEYERLLGESPSDDDDDRITNKYRMNFTIDLHNKSNIGSAELRLFKIPQNKVDGKPDDRVELYRIRSYPGGDSIDEEDYPSFVAGKTVSSESSGFIVFDIAEEIEQWVEWIKEKELQMNEQELEFEVIIKCPENINRDTLYQPAIQFEIENRKATQLVVRAYEGDRERRAVSNTCVSSSATTNCCVRPLTINFQEDLDWTWITHPVGNVEVNYCDGYCPAFWKPITYNRFFLSYINFMSKSNPTASPKPCCVGNLMRPLLLQILEPVGTANRSIYTVTLDDVITKECICR